MTPSDLHADRAPAEDMEESDPGLAAERTGLAWSRTAISFAAVGGALLRTAPAAGGVVLGMSVLVWGLSRLSGRSEPLTRRHRSRRLLLITVTVAVVSSVALALVLVSGPARSLR